MSNPIKGFQRLTEADVDYAAQLVHSGLDTDTIRARLVERGMTPPMADSALKQVVERQAMADAYGMLKEGKRPDAVKAMLLDRGVSPFVADEMIQEGLLRVASERPGPGAVRKVIGGVVVLIGIALLIGNMTGAFRTFPFAGFIVIFIGLAIMGS